MRPLAILGAGLLTVGTWACGKEAPPPTTPAPVAPAENGKAAPEVGRLAPEIIQRVVRSQFGDMKKCYERGLARDPNLRGRFAVKFVIARNGHVSSAEDGGSDLPDPAVNTCVRDVFAKLVFPEPEGGIVTVVYPIVFAPGE